MGADDYITKPFRPRELIERIGTALRKSGRSVSNFEIRGLHVDTASGIVKKNGSEVFLSALEYRLLLVFINNPKSIIPRGRLLDELWDAAGEFVNDNTLTVYIKRLREKIENDPASPQIILTVRGTEYRSSSYQTVLAYSSAVKASDFTDRYREYAGYAAPDETVHLPMDIQFIENSEYLDFIKELGFSAEQCYMPLAR